MAFRAKYPLAKLGVKRRVFAAATLREKLVLLEETAHDGLSLLWNAHYMTQNEDHLVRVGAEERACEWLLAASCVVDEVASRVSRLIVDGELDEIDALAFDVLGVWRSAFSAWTSIPPLHFDGRPPDVIRKNLFAVQMVAMSVRYARDVMSNEYSPPEQLDPLVPRSALGRAVRLYTQSQLRRAIFAIGDSWRVVRYTDDLRRFVRALQLRHATLSCHIFDVDVDALDDVGYSVQIDGAPHLRARTAEFVELGESFFHDVWREIGWRAPLDDLGARELPPLTDEQVGSFGLWLERSLRDYSSQRADSYIKEHIMGDVFPPGAMDTHLRNNRFGATTASAVMNSVRNDSASLIADTIFDRYDAVLALGDRGNGPFMFEAFAMLVRMMVGQATLLFFGHNMADSWSLFRLSQREDPPALGGAGSMPFIVQSMADIFVLSPDPSDDPAVTTDPRVAALEWIRRMRPRLSHGARAQSERMEHSIFTTGEYSFQFQPSVVDDADFPEFENVIDAVRIG